MKKINKIGVMTSGGDSPGMNAAIRSVARTCAFYNIECVGIYRGYEGMIDGDFIQLNARSVKGIINKGGTFLKSARSESFRTKEGRKKAFESLKAENIDALVAIGGDGTFTGSLIFNQEFNFPVIGIPGTIDNDIAGTTHTLGYDTALNTVVEVIDKIRDTASSHNRLFFVEVMGRDAGFIALNAGVGAGAEEILIPEEDLGLERLLESLKRTKRSGKSSSIVVVSEGDKIGKNVFELAADPTKPFSKPEKKEAVPYIDFTPLQNELSSLKETIASFSENDITKLSKSQREAMNEKLMVAEQSLTYEKGLPRRSWYKHQIYAPGFYTGYGVKTLPSVREAVEQKDWKEAQEQIQVLAETLSDFNEYVEEMIEIN